MPRSKDYDLKHLKDGLKPDIVNAITEAFDEGTEEGFSRGEKILQKRAEQAGKKAAKATKQAVSKEMKEIESLFNIDENLFTIKAGDKKRWKPASKMIAQLRTSHKQTDETNLDSQAKFVQRYVAAQELRGDINLLNKSELKEMTDDFNYLIENNKNLAIVADRVRQIYQEQVEQMKAQVNLGKAIPTPEVPVPNQTPLSSGGTTAPSETAEEVKEAAKEIEVADEKIEASNEEVEQSEEELGQATTESRKKATSAAKKQADETKNANDEIIESNKQIEKSQALLDSLSKPAELFSEFAKLKRDVDDLNAQLSAGELSASEYSKEVNKLTSEYSKLVNIQQKRDFEDYKSNNQTIKDATKHNQEAAKAYDDLIQNATTYYTLLSKQKAGIDLGVEESRQLEDLTKKFYEASEAVGVYSRAISGSEESHNRYNTAQARFLQDSAQAYLDSIEKDVGKSFEKYNLSTANKRALQFVEEYENKIKELRAAIENLNNLQKKGIDIVGSNELAKVAMLQAEIESLNKELRIMHNNKEFQGADEEKAYQQIAKISQILEKNTKMSREMREQFKALQQDYEIVIKTGGSQKRLEELNAELAKMNAHLQASGRTGNSFFNLVGKKINGMAAEFFATYLSLQDLLQLARQGFEIIKEYDSALTEMNKVADESLSTLKEFQQESFELADSIGATASALQNSTAEFLRLGESLEEAKQSAIDATTLFKVSEFDTVEEATEALIALSQAYQDLDKSEINDIINLVGNEFSISSEGLATALQSSAAALKVAGNDIYEAAALATAGNALIMDPASAGAGIRTISLRIMGTKEAKDQLASLGEDVDDFVVQTQSKLDEQVRKYTAVAANDFAGVSLLDDNGNYRSTYEVLQDIANVYDEIVEADKKAGSNRMQALLELIAGKSFCLKFVETHFYRTHLIALIA